MALWVKMYQIYLHNILFSCDGWWPKLVARADWWKLSKLSLNLSVQVGQQGPIWVVCNSRFPHVQNRQLVKLFGRIKSALYFLLQRTRIVNYWLWKWGYCLNTTHKSVKSQRSRFMLFRCQRFCTSVYLVVSKQEEQAHSSFPAILFKMKSFCACQVDGTRRPLG